MSMNKEELKKLDAQGLESEISSMRQELFNLRMSLISGQVKDYSQFKKLRSGIARAKTFSKQQLHDQSTKA